VSKLGRLSGERLAQLRDIQKAERDRRAFQRPADFFPWHDIQKWVLESPGQVEGDVRMMFIAGGNRGGKSAVGKGLLSQVVRRTNPINDQLRTMDKYTGQVRKKHDRDPLTVWIVPPTLEKARQDWITPQDGFGIRYWLGNLYLDHKKSPDLVFYSRPPGMTEEECWKDGKTGGTVLEDRVDKVLIKSQDQKLETFESSACDLIIFDEEPAGAENEKKWQSCRMRVGTTHGVLVMTYTPLHGLSWSYKKHWKPLVKDGRARKVADRCWIFNPPGDEANVICAQMGSADNPLAKDYAREIEASKEFGEAEKAARLYGEYGYVEGALLPSLAGIDVLEPLPEHEVYVVDDLPGQRIKGTDDKVPGRITNWFLITDPNKSYGAVLGALDANGNLFYVSEHLEESWPDRKHAEAFKDMEKAWVTGRIQRFADPGGAGAHSIVNMASYGLAFETMPKGAGSVSSSIKRLRGMTYVDPSHAHPITGEKGAPRVYFYRPGLLRGGKFESELANQLSEARQTDNENAPTDTPHKDIRSKLDLFDCARYMAVIVVDIPISGDTPGSIPGHDYEEKLPSDIPFGKKEPVANPWDMELDLPQYDFSGGGVW
jgi:phage terminase large subunit-like protein